MDSPLVRAWELHLKLRRASPATMRSYLSTVRALENHLGSPVETATRADIRRWLADMQDDGAAPSTVDTRLKGAKQLFRWLKDEGDVAQDPTAGISVPAPLPDIRVLSLDEIRALLATCSGKSFIDVRDNALLRTLVDTGIRRSECVGSGIGDIDTRAGALVVSGKGSRGNGPRARVVGLGAHTSIAIERYLRQRPAVETDALWLSRTAYPLTSGGLYLLVRERGRQAGIPHLHPHALRHTWAAEACRSGLSEGNVVTLGGWSNRSMLDRYGRATASERALEAYRDHSLGDRL